MKGSWLKFLVYLLLTVGAVTMVFPFFWMLATSFKSSLEVLSAQITLVPRLKKYIRQDGKLEPVEFLYALKLIEAVNISEGLISEGIPKKNELSSRFLDELSEIYSDYRSRIGGIFLRYRPESEVGQRLDGIWENTMGRIDRLPSAERLPADVRTRVDSEIDRLSRTIRNLGDETAFRENLLAVVILAGDRRGAGLTVSATDIIYKRFLWSNFLKAWRAAPFARYFVNSIIMSIAVTIGQVLTSALAAYAFARMQFRFKETIFLILLGTMMVPKQVILIPDYVIIAKLGWINTYYALIVPFVAAVFGIYFMRQHFETIPQDLFDAASIDGCGRLRTLFQIVLPLSRGVVITVALFTFIMTWNSLLWPLVMTNTPEMRPLQVGLAVFNQESGTEWELLMAASTFSILPLLIIFFVAQKQFIEGITRSGMKG